MPFLVVLEIHKSLNFFSRFLLYGSYFGLIILSQASLNFGMLAPIEPTVWLLDWPLKEKIGEELTYSLLNLVQSCFAAVLLWISYQSYQQIKNHASS